MKTANSSPQPYPGRVPYQCGNSGKHDRVSSWDEGLFAAVRVAVGSITVQYDGEDVGVHHAESAVALSARRQRSPPASSSRPSCVDGPSETASVIRGSHHQPHCTAQKWYMLTLNPCIPAWALVHIAL